MTSKAKFKSDAFEAIYSAAQGLQRAGTIDKATMRDFDESCLASPVEIAPEAIKRIREGAHVSQPVFVQKWEAGTKRPSGMALKLLAVVEKHGLKVLA